LGFSCDYLSLLLADIVLFSSIEETNKCQRVNEDVGPKGVDNEIPRQLEKETKYSLSRCENFYLTDLKGKTQKEQFQLAIDLDNHKEKHKKNNIC